MSATCRREGRVLRVTLDGELGVADVGTLWAQLVEEVDGETEMLLDVTALSRLDTSIAQLVFILGRRARSYEVIESPAWAEAWSTLGLDRPT